MVKFIFFSKDFISLEIFYFSRNILFLSNNFISSCEKLPARKIPARNIEPTPARENMASPPQEKIEPTTSRENTPARENIVPNSAGNRVSVRETVKIEPTTTQKITYV